MRNAQFAALSLCSILLIYCIAKNFVTKNFVIWSTLTATIAAKKFHLTKLRTKFVTKPADDDGNVMWAKQICEENFKSSGFSVVYDNKNAYIFYTQDPEYKDADGGMYVMCVDITGNVDAINEVPVGDEVLSTEIYTIDGRRVSHLEDGVNIVRTTYKNGNVTTTKVMR